MRSINILRNLNVYTEYKDNEQQKPAVRIKDGLLEGFQENGVFKFYGVPYAAPPVGKVRWCPPQPVEPWEDARDATKFGNIAYQISRKEDVSEEDKDLIEDEDCLYLNIWTPSISADDNMPVMVWIHGGGFLNGSGSFNEYSGAELSKKGVVIVTFNYRLGPLGFISHKELESNDMLSGNYGMLDQIAVLEWIQRNISNFGGDRDNVTIFGESAGAMSVGLLSTSTRALGLYHKVICESGGMLMFPREIPYDKALRDTLELQKALGASNVEEMRLIPAPDIIAAAKKISANDEMPRQPRYSPVLDNIVIKSQDETLRERAKFPLIIGNNKHEATWFMQFLPAITLDNYREILKRNFGQITMQMLAIFTINSDEEARNAFISVYTYNLFTKHVHDVARRLTALGGNIYVYRFDRVAPKNQANGLHAAHGEEIPYVFGHVSEQGYSKTDEKVSEEMMKYWVQFSKTGNPNVEGLPEWPRYTTESNNYIILDGKVSVEIFTDDLSLYEK
jgi:para-nitrobenzyl esterase